METNHISRGSEAGVCSVCVLWSPTVPMSASSLLFAILMSVFAFLDFHKDSWFQRPFVAFRELFVLRQYRTQLNLIKAVQKVPTQNLPANFGIHCFEIFAFLVEVNYTSDRINSFHIIKKSFLSIDIAFWWAIFLSEFN